MSLTQQVANLILEPVAGNPTGEPSVSFIFALTCPDGATANLDWTLPNYAIRVIDVWAVKTGGVGGAADAAQLQTGAGAAIGSSHDLNIADTTIARATTLDDANWEIAAAGTIRVRRTEGAADGSAILFAHCVRT